MRLVVLESPYAGRGWWPASIWYRRANVRFARACARDSLKRGEAPLASHLLYTQPGIMSDRVPNERNLGIMAGLAWGKYADATVVYTDFGISNGMELGIAAAKRAGRPIEYRRLSK
jgi:hypothetical protein